jgi:uroporphyrinogen III methyltransferase / synthase
MTSSLAGVRIVLTRPEEQGSRMRAALLERGAQVISFPTIQVAPLKDQTRLHRALERLETFDWVVFTSFNGVRFTLEYYAKHAQHFGVEFSQVKIAVVGHPTRIELERFALRVDFVPKVFNGESLAFELAELENLSGKRIAFFTALEHRPELPAAFQELGADVEIIPTYQTQPVKPDLEAIHALGHSASLQYGAPLERPTYIFYSPSALKAFCQVVPDAKALLQAGIVATIGSTTANAAQAHGLRVDVTPDEFTSDALVQVLEDFYAKGADQAVKDEGQKAVLKVGQ